MMTDRKLLELKWRDMLTHFIGIISVTEEAEGKHLQDNRAYNRRHARLRKPHQIDNSTHIPVCKDMS